MNSVITDTERKIIRRDPDGHYYSIPESMVEHFTSLTEAIISTDCGSTEWYDANDEMDDVFGSYMKGD